MKYLLIATLMLFGHMVMASEHYIRVSVQGEKITRLDRWSADRPNMRTKFDVPLTDFPTNDIKYLKWVTNKVVVMTSNEMAVVDNNTRSNAVADADLTAFEDALLGYLADKNHQTKEELRAEIKAKVNKDKKEKDVKAVK